MAPDKPAIIKLKSQIFKLLPFSNLLEKSINIFTCGKSYGKSEAIAIKMAAASANLLLGGNVEEIDRSGLEEALFGRQARDDLDQEANKCVWPEEAYEAMQELIAENEKAKVIRLVKQALYKELKPNEWVEIVIYANKRGAAAQVVKHC